jgi:ABC-type transporter Mla subunit MlaD
MSDDRMPAAAESIEFLTTAAMSFSAPAATTGPFFAAPEGSFSAGLLRAAKELNDHAAEIEHQRSHIRAQIEDMATLTAEIAAKDAQISHILDDYQYWLDARMARDKARAETLES